MIVKLGSWIIISRGGSCGISWISSSSYFLNSDNSRFSGADNSDTLGNSGFDDSDISDFGNSETLRSSCFARGEKSSFGSWGMFDSKRLRVPETIVLGFPDIIAIIMNEKMIVDKEMQAMV